MVTPQQRPGALNLTHYDAQGNSLLAYGAARFPVIPLINGYTDEGDDIDVITLTFDVPNCKNNLAILERDLAELAAKKGVSCHITSIGVPFDSSTKSVLNYFLKLIEHVDDDDVIHACITFGTKPITVVMMMLLRYAYQMKSNVSVECVVYGEQDYQSDPPTGRIHDMTSLLKLDELVGTMVDLQIDDPTSLLKHVIEM